ncbi:salicylate synthase [Streptomyces nodosus]|uniref:Salicylate synthase n=1 Tax=Streptomyces nodosus TaxID=40318 RepID=A0A0B5DUA2_9ACTN|nr:salicylate synthase [Streptomyces nodosus]AJE43707.1 Salicylate synthase [Streptomyces nodosus]MBB4795218.1 salicylate synthetase [Streptomyces nodosus]QEV42212.1 salicylate synthase [Streptomyces nodosus]
MSTGSRNIWEAWARSVAPLVRVNTGEPCPDPAATATRLAQAGLADQYMVYEGEGGVWHFAAGSAMSVTADSTAITAQSGGRTWTSRTDRQPLTAFAAALSALREAGDEGRHFYGWAAFELAHLLHADAATAGEQPLLHALIPSVEVTLTGDRTVVRAVDEAWARKVADLLAEPPAGRTAHDEPMPERAEGVIATGTAAYGGAVSRTVGDIHAGLLEKAVVSRKVPLPAEPRPDFPATYLAGRRANTPARSYLMDLGGYRAAGFSPETVLEVGAEGRVSTQPLAGTRARGADPAENERRRAELLSDPKEIHEHAVSVRLAWDEMAAVCRPGSVAVEEFMTVRPRGSVQHLASRVTGRLRPDCGPWDAFASLFPAITATGVSKRDALHALARHEDGPRGLYGGAVFRGSTDGDLDAALVLRTLIGAGDEAWLRAGAGVTAQSSPEREIEETCEKLRSVAPYLRFAAD